MDRGDNADGVSRVTAIPITVHTSRRETNKPEIDDLLLRLEELLLFSAVDQNSRVFCLSLIPQGLSVDNNEDIPRINTVSLLMYGYYIQLFSQDLVTIVLITSAIGKIHIK